MPPLPHITTLLEQGLISYNTWFRLDWTRIQLLAQVLSLERLSQLDLTRLVFAKQDILLHQEYYKSWGIDDLCKEFMQHPLHSEGFGDAMAEWESWIDQTMDRVRALQPPPILQPSSPEI
jgi:hypothetical protein